MIDSRPDANQATNGPDHTAPMDAMFSADVRGMLREQEDRAREFTRAHPIGVVLAALAFGFVAARVLRED